MTYPTISESQSTLALLHQGSCGCRRASRLCRTLYHSLGSAFAHAPAMCRVNATAISLFISKKSHIVTRDSPEVNQSADPLIEQASNLGHLHQPRSRRADTGRQSGSSFHTCGLIRPFYMHSSQFQATNRSHVVCATRHGISEIRGSRHQRVTSSTRHLSSLTLHHIFETGVARQEQKADW